MDEFPVEAWDESALHRPHRRVPGEPGRDPSHEGAGPGGRIINIASVLGLVPMRLQSSYVAAKAGAVNLTRSMALELAPRQDPRQRHRAGLHGHRGLGEVDPSGQGGAGRACAADVAHPSCAGPPPRRRSRTARCSWSRPRAPTSPAISWRSTAAGPPASPAISDGEPVRPSHEPLPVDRLPNTPPFRRGWTLQLLQALSPDAASAALRAGRAGRLPQRRDAGFLHLYIGEEATAVGICAHLH